MFHGTTDCACAHVTRKNAVFRIILIISCTKRGAVRVHARSIPALAVHFFAHPSHSFAIFFDKLFVPSGCNNNFDREANGTCMSKVVVDRGWTIKISS